MSCGKAKGFEAQVLVQTVWWLTWLNILAWSIVLKISVSAWTKTNVEFIENQTKTRQSGLYCLQSPGSWNPVSSKTCRGRWLTSDFFYIDLKFCFVIWKLALFREMVFLACFPCVWTCMSIKLVIFETNQIHVGGALGDRQEINKSSFEIFVCILLTSNHMVFLVQFGINEHL